MSAQWFVGNTMNLQCPVALSREGLSTGGSWDMWDLVAFKCVREVFFFVCCAEQDQGSFCLGRWFVPIRRLKRLCLPYSLKGNLSLLLAGL